MDIADVDSYFDDDPVYDAYTGALLFHCHTTPHDDHTSSGATARRRTMTTVPGTAAPARAVVQIHGETWLVGNSNVDSFQGVPIRRSYGLKKSSGLVSALTPGEVCLAAAGTEFHVHKEYFRDTQDAKTSADWDVMWNVFCPPGEPVAKGTFLRQGATLLRVRNAYPSIEDLTIAEADQLDADARQPVTFISSVLDLVADTRTATSVSTWAIQTDPQKCYQFRTLAESTLQPGDRAVYIAKAAYMPVVGAEFTMQGAKWRALTIVSEQDAWLLHVRLA
jgi:hypothetical protein